jgi:NADPH:quinone reductase-like Zn-dependent oxidoreductase
MDADGTSMRPVKAAVRTRYGPPDVVRISEVETPAARDNELLVKVHATTVNRTDCHYRSGTPWIMRPLLSGLARPKASILGNEFAGQIVGIGSCVTSCRTGDRVFGYVEGPFGAHAEFLVIREDGLVAAIPRNLSYEQAAPATEAAHYAMSHIRRAEIHGGQNVMVYGATGGIGSAAVQLLKILGARVTAVCATAHLELVRKLGADRVIDYTVRDFTSDGHDYDVVFDAVGKSSFGRCKRLLKPAGIYMSTGPGPWYQNLILPITTPLLGGKKVLFAYPRLDQATVRHFSQLMESGQFTPVIDRQFALTEVVDAYRYVEAGQKIGNVVIIVDPAVVARG